jgi:hypothetical protein
MSLFSRPNPREQISYSRPQISEIPAYLPEDGIRRPFGLGLRCIRQPNRLYGANQRLGVTRNRGSVERIQNELLENIPGSCGRHEWGPRQGAAADRLLPLSRSWRSVRLDPRHDGAVRIRTGLPWHCFRVRRQARRRVGERNGQRRLVPGSTGLPGRGRRGCRRT